MEKRIIDLVQEQCDIIIKNKLSNCVLNRNEPYAIISKDQDSKYILTLICDDRSEVFSARQSEYIDLDTNLEQTLERLFNRTMWLWKKNSILKKKIYLMNYTLAKD